MALNSMAVVTNVEPIDRDLILSLVGTPKERSAIFAEFAREQLADAEQLNESVLGHIPTHTTFVDGREGASEDDVRPDGEIVYEFALVTDLFIWIADQLRTHAPVKSGTFRDSFAFFADGNEIDIGGEIPAASEYVFLNTQPYARKIERGESPQAPEGLFQVVATLAQERFGDLARITFAYRAPVAMASASRIRSGPRGDRRSSSDGRTPAIMISVK